MTLREPEAYHRLGDLIKTHFGTHVHAVLVADERTWNIAGRLVFDALKEAGIAMAPSCIFPAIPQPHTNEYYIEKAGSYFKGEHIVPIAVGSGTINDIVKRSAYKNNIRYICIPTAPSVDGYTSYGSAATINGFKQTLKCPAPIMVVADQHTLISAPLEMIASGYGDLFAKIPAGADWIISDSLGITPIRDEIWVLVQENLKSIVKDAQSIKDRNPDAIRNLYEGLVNSGLAMQ